MARNILNIHKVFWYSLLAIIIVGACLARIDLLHEREFTYDEALYAYSAERITEDPKLIFSLEITEYHPPLFPLTLALGKALFRLPAALLSYSLIMILISLLGILGIFLLGSRRSSYFLGTFCALSLAFNVTYSYSSIYLLNDILYAVLSIFLLLALKNTEESSLLKADVFVSFILSLIICTKYSGLIIIPFTIIYYAFLPKPINIKLKKFTTAFSLVVVTLSVLSMINLINRGTILPAFNAMNAPNNILATTIELLNYYIIHNIPGLLLLGFLIGLTFSILKKDYYGKMLIIYILIGLLGLLSLKLQALHYGFFLLPAIFIITGCGIERIINIIFKQKRLIFYIQMCILLVLIPWYSNNYNQVKNIIYSKLIFVPDYRLAAAWVKEQATPKTIIFSQEPRVMRYHTKINFKQFGGQISKLPENRTDIIHVLTQTKGHVIFDVNRRRLDSDANFQIFTKPKIEEALLKNYGYSLMLTSYQKYFCELPIEQCPPIPTVKIFEKY